MDTIFAAEATIWIWLGSLPGLVFAVLQIAGTWRVFQKAGRPGWAAIIPFYSAYTYNKVGGKPGWWWILWLVPVVGLVITVIVALGVARNFGKSGAFGFWGLWFFPYIGYPLLGWGAATYRPVEQAGPAASGAPAVA
jgi:hypothetical protein